MINTNKNLPHTIQENADSVTPIRPAVEKTFSNFESAHTSNPSNRFWYWLIGVVIALLVLSTAVFAYRALIDKRLLQQEQTDQFLQGELDNLKQHAQTAKLEVADLSADFATIKTLIVTESAQIPGIDVSGDTIMGGNLTVNSHSNLNTLNTTGDLTVGGNLTTLGTSTFQNNITANTNLHVNSNLTTNGNLVLVGSANMHGAVFNTSTNNNGRFYINDNTQITGSLFVDGTIHGSVSGTINPNFTPGSVVFQGSSGLSQNNANLFWDNTNNRLGIGTNVPAYGLDITGAAIVARFSGRVIGTDAVNVNEFVTLGQLSTVSAGNYFLQNGNSFGETAVLGTNDNFGLAIETNGLERMRIDAAGNVGIGTTNPSNKLHVSSTTSGDGISIDNTANPALNLRASGTVRGYLGVATAANAWTSGSAINDLVLRAESSSIHFANNGGALPTMTLLTSGNVGIGTTAPTQRLDLGSGNLTTTGRVFIGDGASGSPSLAFAAVPTTGIFRPAGNAIGFQIAGTEYMRLSSTGGLSFGSGYVATNPGANNLIIGGNVGIGTTTPGYTLDVNGGLRVIGTNGDVIVPSNGNEILMTRAGANYIYSNNATGSLYLGAGGITDVVSIRNTGASSNTLYLQNGRVGIGTTAPTSLLAFSGQAARTIQTERHTTADTAGNDLTLKVGGATSGATDKNGGNLILSGGISTGTGTSQILFQTATAGTTGTTDRTPSTKMVIQGDGNVGIGTTAPANALHVLKAADAIVGRFESASSSTGIELNNTNTGGRRYALFSTANASSIGGGKLAIQDLGSAAWRLVIDNAGNVGVANTSPGTQLHVGAGIVLNTNDAGGTLRNPDLQVSKTSGYAMIGVAVNNGTNDRRAGFFVDQTNAAWGLSASYTSGAIPFVIRGGTTGGEQIRIDNSGNLGIGTTNPQHRLEIIGGNGILQSSVATDATLKTARIGVGHYTNAEEPFYWAVANGNNGANQLLLGGGTSLGNAATSIQLYTASDSITTTGIERMRISNTGGLSFGSGYVATNPGANNAIFEGNVGIGTSAPNNKLEVVGGASGVETALLQIRSNFSTTNTTSSIRFVNSASATSTSGAGEIAVLRDASNGSSMLFRTADTGSTLRERLRIDNSGNVGIGTAAPVSRLDVRQAWTHSVGTNLASQFRIRDLDGATAMQLELGADTTNKVSIIQSAEPGIGYRHLSLQPSGGNVGVGLTTPSNPLSINQAAHTTPSSFNSYGLALYNQGNYNLTFGSDAGFNYIQSWQNKPLQINNQGNSTLLNPTSGNVGIGTTTPTTGALQVSTAVPDVANGSAIFVNSTMSSTTNSQYGLRVGPTISPSSASTINYFGITGVPTSSSANMTTGVITGVSAHPTFSGTGTLGTMIGFSTVLQNISTGTVNTAYGIRINTPSNSGTLANTNGLRIESQTVGTQTNTPYAIFQAGASDRNYFAGNVGIGTTSPQAGLHVYQKAYAWTATSGTSNTVMSIRNGADAERFYWNYDNTNIKLQLFDSSSNNLFTAFGGNVGIGTTSPGSRLDVYNATGTSDIDIFRILSDVGGANNVKFRIDSDGDIFTDGSTTIGTPADIAENYQNADGAKPGEVVVFTNPTTVAKSSSSYQKGLAGVVSTAPGIVLSGNTVGVSVALAGKVPTKVSVSNGAIEPGDYLTGGPNGVAIKATKAGPIIGTAMEGTVTDGTIEVFVHLGHYYPTGTQTLQGQDNSSNPQSSNTSSDFSSINVSALATITELKVTGNATIAGNLSVKGVTTVAKIVIDGHISAGNDTVGEIIVNASSAYAIYEFKTAYSKVPEVIVTPKQNTADLRYWVEASETGFKLHLSQTTNKAIKFSYFVIENN